MSLPETPSQTVGPFFSIGLTWEDGARVVPEGAEGALWLLGRILDGEGAPIPDAVVETWQADPHGHLDAPGFRGFGRGPTDEDGRWRVLTLKPGPVGDQAPHVDLAIFARGLLRQVLTRLYFPDETERNAADPVLSSLDADARATLVAQPSDDGYALDIHLQGPHATAFFAF
jgi:protocatechuate 3,4-dioxygenase alpha subunit